jgi:hypothetical protein
MSEGRYLHRTTQTNTEENGKTSMPPVVLEPKILLLELGKTFHASDHAATVVGRISNFKKKKRRSGK